MHLQLSLAAVRKMATIRQLILHEPVMMITALIGCIVHFALFETLLINSFSVSLAAIRTGRFRKEAH